MSADTLVVYMWFDKRTVYILSTKHKVYSDGEYVFSHVKRKSPSEIPMTVSYRMR